MGFFKNRKESKVLDLTEKLRRQQQKVDEIKQDLKETSQSSSSSDFVPFPFLADNSAFNSSSSSSYPNSDEDDENPSERKRKLAKRLMDITNKLEDLSNQIYHLQQRIEVVERKLDVNRF